MKADNTVDRADVDVQVAASGAHVPQACDIEYWARAAAGGGDVELTVRVTEEREMARLNERYRRKKGSTNVLSFAFEMPGDEWPDQAPPINLLGDVVVCQQVVEREAQEQGKALDAHFAHMVVHGVLHLRGYDHEDARQAEAMEAEERRVLAELGFDDPYAAEWQAGGPRQSVP